jgi:molecular chaperone DnaJ
MDLYAVLGLAPGASISDVKRAYRRLSRRYHPGLNPGDRAAEALFQRITEAYETLSDAERRRQYDTAGVAAVAAGGGANQVFEFSGFDFSVAAQGPAAATFSELFAEALNPVPSQEAGRPQPGADIHASLSLAFEEAMTGVDRQLIVTRQVPCGACRGAGYVRSADAKCAHCHGSGTVRWARGHMVFTKSCTACGATGRERHRRCPVCAGHGRSVRSEALTVHVPAGVPDGTQLRIAERGHAGALGGRPGDLYVDVQVRPHAVLRRDHDDLHLIAPVAVHEAALGARIEVPSFDGPVRLKIPPGTQGGQRLRVSGRGAPTVSGRRGDLFVEVRLAMPPIADERSKELMKEFARLNPMDVRRDLQKQFGAEG